ncbi:MAG TPA: hypothetical protein VKE74_05290 [Gemmataceae bacterium]|nr:hypothetical protein [Gemmataceae bacterium]
MITISGKALGSRRPLFADWSVPFPPDLADGGDNLTLRELIARIVVAEVGKFNARQIENQTFRALTEKEIAAAAAKGKVDMGGRDHPPQKADPQQAIATAITAFEDGLYLVVIDEVEQKELDKEVFLKPDSRVTFIRLTMLAGG